MAGVSRSFLPRVLADRRRAAVQRRAMGLGLCAVVVLAAVRWGSGAEGFSAAGPPMHARGGASRSARQAAPSMMENPVRTVADTIDAFYTEYPKPPVLPMYRTFLIDFLTQAHLASVDARFKYDAVWALGFMEWYNGLMGSYDKMVGGGDQADKILAAMVKALGMDIEKVKGDAEAVKAYATATAPAQILKHLEGAEAPADSRISDAFSGISGALYSSSFSIGLFTVMELSGVDTSKDNVDEWAKALKVSSGKVTNDLETYKMNKNKLQKAEEMLREIEIREKKKLAERLEAKAKALAEKASGKKAEASE